MVSKKVNKNLIDENKELKNRKTTLDKTGGQTMMKSYPTVV